MTIGTNIIKKAILPQITKRIFKQLVAFFIDRQSPMKIKILPIFDKKHHSILCTLPCQSVDLRLIFCRELYNCITNAIQDNRPLGYKEEWRHFFY